MLAQPLDVAGRVGSPRVFEVKLEQRQGGSQGLGIARGLGVEQREHVIDHVTAEMTSAIPGRQGVVGRRVTADGIVDATGVDGLFGFVEVSPVCRPWVVWRGGCRTRRAVEDQHGGEAHGNATQTRQDVHGFPRRPHGASSTWKRSGVSRGAKVVCLASASTQRLFGAVFAMGTTPLGNTCNTIDVGSPG